MSAAALSPSSPTFYERPVVEVAADLVGCIVRHGDCAGRIVETEAYHESEPACHAFSGLTARTAVLFGPPGHAYVYRSYGVHALLNAVAEPAGVGAAALIRALEPLDGLAKMRERRALRSDPSRAMAQRDRIEDLCSGPGKLTQALGIGLDLNGAELGGPIEVLARPRSLPPPEIAIDTRIGITKAVELPWRFCDTRSRCVSRPWPKAASAVAS